MLLVILMMITGIFAGHLLEGKVPHRIADIISALIWALLFVLGVKVGSDGRIVASLGTLGLEALFIGLASTSGSVLLSWALWKWFCIRRAGQTGRDTRTHSDSAAGRKGGLWGSLRGSLVIAAFFVTGAAAGLAVPDLPEDVSGYLDKASLAVLCALMFCVGLNVGGDRTVLGNFRHIDPIMAMLPAATVAGALAASALCAPALAGRSLSDCLAVGSGLGYYSLSSVLITEVRGADLGTVALLANIVREIITLIGAPLTLKAFGPLAPIAAGGCTTADTTLPVITHTCGKDFVIISVFHGIAVDFFVPFLVSAMLVL